MERILIVGAGKGGRSVLNRLLRFKWVQIVGVVDRIPDAPGILLAKKEGLPVFTEAPLEVLKRLDVDLVFNLTGNLQIEQNLLNAPDRSFDVVTGQMVHLLWDVLQELEQEKEIRLRLSAIVESSDDAIIGVTLEGMIDSWNRGAERLYGYAAEEILGLPLTLIVPSDRLNELQEILNEAWNGEVTGHLETVRRHKDGRDIHISLKVSPIKDSTGQLIGVSGIAHDVTDKRMTEKSIHYMAYYDRLTGLPNRAHFIEHLEKTILLEEDKDKRIVFFLINLPGLKEVNDSLGLDYTDLLLQSVAQKLLALFGPSQMLARLGGDEFGLLLTLAGREEITLAANKILKLFGKPLEIEGFPLYIEASIGIAISPDHGTSASPLFQKADVALNEAKKSGSGFNIYNLSKNKHSPQRIALMGELHHAIDSNQLILHYQPKINLQTGKISGVEALVRWQHPKRGLVSPAEFILPAEQTGLIKPLTQWVLNEALHQCSRWEKLGKRVSIAVNLAVRNIQDPQLPDQIDAFLQKFNISPSLLEVEVTESTIMTDEDRAIKVLKKLREKGISIAIDDFGKGHSSLTYLRKLSARTIKIDNSFVANMIANREDAVIVRSTINLGHNLGLKVTAEGVENQEVLDRLIDLGCDEAQGYYIARPFPPSEFDQQLNEMEQRGGWTLAS